MDSSLETQRTLALENYRKEVLNTPSFSSNQRRVATISGKIFSPKEVEEEMSRELVTPEGLSLIQIWARPTEEIRREIQLARNRI